MSPGDAPYRHRGTRAVQRMVEYAPSTGGLALWVRHHDVHTDEAVRVPNGLIATDGETIHYGGAFEKLGVAAQAGYVSHAVLHVALRHPQRMVELEHRLGDVDPQLFNICADAIVNSALAHLAWIELPRSAVMLERLLETALGLNENAERALAEWSVERLYRAIDDRREPKDERTGDSKSASKSTPRRADGPKSARVREMGASQGMDLIPGPAREAAPEAEAELAREWRERVVRGHAGDGEHSMLRALLADLPTTRTPWEQVLRAQLNRSLSPRPAPSWSRPARSWLANQGRTHGGKRMPWEPGRVASRAVPRLAVIADVSGSIDDALLDRFANEIEAILRRLESDMVIVIGDDQVRHVAKHDPNGRRGIDLREIEFAGGGGTDFTPLLEEADKHRPDIGVVITDLQGPARFRPRWPVLWAVPEEHEDAVAPFGRKLVLA